MLRDVLRERVRARVTGKAKGKGVGQYRSNVRPRWSEHRSVGKPLLGEVSAFNVAVARMSLACRGAACSIA